MKLTERRIEQLTVEPGRKDRLVSDDDQRGLYVRVTKGTKRGDRAGKSFLCKFTLHGKKEKRPLGSFAAISLADAREAAAAIMGDIARGKDPAAEHREAKAAAKAKRRRDQLTMRVLINDWKQHLSASRRPRDAEEAVRALHRAFADHLDDPAEDLDRGSIVRALDALVRRRGRKPRAGDERPKGIAMRDRTAAYGRAAFTRAVKRGLVHSNPFKSLPVERATSERDRVLSDQEIAEIWTTAGEMAQPLGSIVHLLILTGQRRGEVAELSDDVSMTWSKLTDDLSMWIMPRARTKNATVHTVPLSEPARELLRSLLPKDEKEARRVMDEKRARRARASAVGPRPRRRSTSLSRTRAQRRRRKREQLPLRLFPGTFMICEGLSLPVYNALASGSR